MEHGTTSCSSSWKLVLVIGGVILAIGSFLPWYYVGANGFFIVKLGAGDAAGAFPLVTMASSVAAFAAVWFDRGWFGGLAGATGLVAGLLTIGLLESTKGGPCAGWCYGGPSGGWVIVLIGGSLAAVGGLSAWIAPRLTRFRWVRLSDRA